MPTALYLPYCTLEPEKLMSTIPRLPQSWASAYHPASPGQMYPQEIYWLWWLLGKRGASIMQLRQCVLATRCGWGFPVSRLTNQPLGHSFLNPSFLIMAEGSLLWQVGSELKFWKSVLEAQSRTCSSTWGSDEIISTQFPILNQAVPLPSFYLSFYIS